MTITRSASKILFLVPIFISLNLQAGDHVAFNLKNSGIKKVIKSALAHYLKSNKQDSLIVPAKMITGTIHREEVAQNPIMRQMQGFLDIPEQGNLSYHLVWSDIKIKSHYDDDTVKVIHSGDRENLNASIGVEFTEVSIQTDRIEICEFYEQGACLQEKGFYGRLEGVEISLAANSRISALVKGHVSIEGHSVKLKFSEVISNLSETIDTGDSKLLKVLTPELNPPQFDINFKSFYMPPPILHVNGQSFELNVEEIQNLLLAEKDFMAKSFTRLIGNFIAQDLVEVINDYFITQLPEIKSQVSMLEYNRGEYLLDRFVELSRENPQEALRFLNQFSARPEGELSTIEKIKYVARAKISEAESKFIFRRLETPRRDQLSIFFDNRLQVNKKELKLLKKIRNGRQNLGKLIFEETQCPYDFAVAFSESYFNGLLNLASETRLLQAMFGEIHQMKGFYLNGLNIHFAQIPYRKELKKIKLVANVTIILSEMESEGIGSWIGNMFAAVLEKNVIWFPLEIDLEVNLDRLNRDGKIILDPKDPFGPTGELRNTYGYPFKDMNGIVKRSLYKKLKEKMAPMFEEKIEIDINNYLEEIPGLKMSAQTLYYHESGHLVFAMQLDELNLGDFSSNNEDKETQHE